ncbi:ATP synthase protein I [Methylophilus rhizosphaerae]|uniref:ATP synthase protein I n=2 Tax=Methylophilus rhizosphaerae TaxID=492660 RepID=A0A1G9E7Z9_9PROT|nr:ATP synthase subunit I [Methylophilus rhizosphaerae]SDK72269.1 ATP synthase protein I [Methylophilus rhizosphaerae]
MAALETNQSATQTYRNMLRWQAIAMLVVALVAGALAGMPAGISALLGGGAVIVGAWFAAKIAEKGQSQTQATAVLLNLLKAEAVKILIVAMILFAVFKLYQSLVPFALIAGLAATALFSGAALAKSQTPV